MSAIPYPYAFNGKRMENVELYTSNQYDYGMRYYDARVGRFYSVDPLTSKYPWYTPYQFAGNKPISAIDLDGLEEYELNRNNEGKFSLNYDWNAKPLSQGKIYFNGTSTDISS